MKGFEIPVGQLLVMGLAMSRDKSKQVVESDTVKGIPAFERTNDKGEKYYGINVTSDNREFFRIHLKNVADKNNPMVVARSVSIAQRSEGEWPKGSSPSDWNSTVNKVIPGHVFTVEVANFRIEEQKVITDPESSNTTTTVVGFGSNILEAWKDAKKQLESDGYEGIINPDIVADILLEQAAYRRTLEAPSAPSATTVEAIASVLEAEEEFSMEPK